jgi:hypothetical protein
VGGAEIVALQLSDLAVLAQIVLGRAELLFPVSWVKSVL